MAALEKTYKINNEDVSLFSTRDGVSLYIRKDKSLVYVVDKNDNVLFSIASNAALELYEE